MESFSEYAVRRYSSVDVVLRAAKAASESHPAHPDPAALLRDAYRMVQSGSDEGLDLSSEEYQRMSASHARLVEEREQVLSTARDFRSKALEVHAELQREKNHKATLSEENARLRYSEDTQQHLQAEVGRLQGELEASNQGLREAHEQLAAARHYVSAAAAAALEQEKSRRREHQEALQAKDRSIQELSMFRRSESDRNLLLQDRVDQLQGDLAATLAKIEELELSQIEKDNLHQKQLEIEIHRTDDVRVQFLQKHQECEKLSAKLRSEMRHTQLESAGGSNSLRGDANHWHDSEASIVVKDGDGQPRGPTNDFSGLARFMEFGASVRTLLVSECISRSK